jgi:ankyrin repeat protein
MASQMAKLQPAAAQLAQAQPREDRELLQFLAGKAAMVRLAVQVRAATTANSPLKRDGAKAPPLNLTLSIPTTMENWDEFICERTDDDVMVYIRAHPELVNTPDCATEQCLLEQAAFYLRTALVDGLLEMGADPNHLDPAGQLPLHSAIASYRDNPELSLTITKSLLRHGADIEKRGLPDFTALHRACLVGALDVVSLLLSCGADANARSEDRGDGGRTPLDVAEMHKHREVAQCLRNHGGENA